MGSRQLLAAFAVACSAGVSVTALLQDPQAPVAAGTAVFVGAGDIARCGTRESAGAMATGRLLDAIEGTVFTVGDHAYTTGSERDFRDCYDPAWGRHKARTYPSPGNHDFFSNNGRAYFAYFGANAGPDRRGYYSYEVGAWHVVSLNSNGDAGPRSAQLAWLKDDLAKHPTACTAAYWHEPLFSSGDHGNNPKMEQVWNVLYDFGVDIVLNGHDHLYERFAPQDPKGKADPARGIREFIVGTGGGGVYKFQTIRPNSEVRDNSSYGVIRFMLAPTSYEWEFIPAIGTFRDAGHASCVTVPPPAGS